MKKIAVLIGLFLGLAFTSAVYASEGVLYNGCTYVPIRGTYEELGFNVEWQPKKRDVILTDDEYKIKIMEGINGFYIEKDNMVTSTTTPVPLRIGDRLFIPLRGIGEAIHADISWDAENKVAHISYKGKDSYIHCTKYGEEKSVKAPKSDMPTSDSGIKCYPNTDIPEFISATGYCIAGSTHHQGNRHAYTYSFGYTAYDTIVKAVEGPYKTALENAGYMQDGEDSLNRTQLLTQEMMFKYGKREMYAVYVYRKQNGKGVDVVMAPSAGLTIYYEN